MPFIKYTGITMKCYFHSDDFNKQIAVGENDIVHIPAPGTQKFW